MRRAGGLILLLAGGLAVPVVAQTTTLLATGAVWKYLDDGSDQGAAWRAPGFTDSGWASGPAELGFGDGDEATTNRAGAVTYYYRTTFNVPSAAAVTNLRAGLLRDDGAVVYLNGVEAFRDNMPEGEVLFDTLAPENAAEPTPFYSFPVDPALLVDGVNVVAVEVHQSATTSSDVSFNFRLTANPMPSIAITTPTNSQTLVASTVVIGGTATPGGPSLTLVEVFAGAAKIGESTSESFSVVWQDVVPGTYALTARMIDSSGLRATSAPVNITVQAVPASVLISAGSIWKYLDTGVDQGTGWTALTFNDSTWKTGPGQLGYGDGDEATTISYGPNSSLKYITYYFRRVITVNNPSAYGSLTMTLTYDDGAVVYVNGTEVHRVGMPTGTITYGTYASAATDYTPDVSSLAASVLVPGTNIIAVEIHQCNDTSSDVSFDLQLEGDIDNVAPTAVYRPDPGSTLLELTMINVEFNESVLGVNASDLLINGEAATSVVTNNPNDFSFYFPQPPTGTVHMAWSALHGITDRGSLANPFAGGSWTYTLDTNVSTTANFIISEFLADNNTGIRDEDGNRSDWIEIKNVGVLQANLDGFFLTDSATNLAKWRFPVGAPPVQANSYLIVWASAKNRTNPVTPLHTNFKLAKEAGNFLALVNSQGQIVSAFTNYPAQQSDISYGRDAVDPSLIGYFTTPTPGKVNSTGGSGFVPEPVFSMDTGIYTNATLTVTLTTSNAPPGSIIRYTLNGAVPTNGSPVYSNAFTLSAGTVIKARVFPPAGTNLFPSPVVAKNYIFLDATARDFNSNLPLMVISTQGQPIPENVPPGGNRVEGTFVIIDTDRGRSSLRNAPQFQGMAGFERYGQTSIGFAKPPIRIEIHDALGNDLDVPLLGMPADSDWRTRNPYNDKTLLNDFLAYELFEQMGHYSLQRRYVECFVDTGGGRLTYPTDYIGVEVLFETIKVGQDRVDVPPLTPYDTTEPNVTGGYIFKKDKDSNGDINFSTGGGTGFSGQALKIHEPKPQELRTTPVYTSMTSWPGANYTSSASNQLRYLVSYLNQMERALYRTDWTNASLIGTTNHYSYYMDVDKFVDQHWIVEFTKQIDGYRLSSYYTKDRLGKVAPYPIWDWNLAFGNAYYLRGGHTNGWYFQEQDEGMTDNTHIWLRRLINGAASMGALLPDNSGNALGVGGDPDFNQKIADRWSVLRTNVLNGTNVLARIDELSTWLSEAAARDLWGKWRGSVIGVELWPNPNGAYNGTSKANHPWDVDYVKPTNYLGNATNSIIGYMKKWVLGRYLWIDGQFTPQPGFNHPGGEVTNGFTLAMTAPLGATNWYTLDGTDPRLPGGGISPSALRYTGPITVTSNVLVFARAKGSSAFYKVWSGPATTPFFTEVPALRITEINYHPYLPQPGNTNDADNFEFIEVKNVGATPIDVNKFRLSGGVTFEFPNVTLQPGQSAVVAKNVVAFQSRYGTGAYILGVFSGNLNNAGDHLVLEGRFREPIHDFSYSDEWFSITDGTGFSLVVANENGPLGNWETAAGWRVSATVGGSPAANDPAPAPRPAILINEALTHSDTNQIPGLMDSVELYNPTDEDVNIGGWYLTDNYDQPRKYQIPEDTPLPAGGHLVFTEAQFNPNPGVFPSFALGADGDAVYLFSADLLGNFTGYAHGFDFGAQANGVTFGRYVITTGEDHFVAQWERTLGTNNAGPLVGPVVISEIMYHPQDVVVANVAYNNPEDEYIELHNFGSSAVPLYDADYPTNTWRLRNAVDFDFPGGVTLPPGGHLLVVSFDPATNSVATAAFRTRSRVPASVPLYGPWNGSLDNQQEAIELRRPDRPDTNGTVPSILVERVKYSDATPWAAAADGLGASLQRLVASDYANEPTNWSAALSTPGTNYFGGTPPAITAEPVSQWVTLGGTTTLSVAATGSAPLKYQWRFNGLDLTGATNQTLTLTNVQVAREGAYTAVVLNSAGAAISAEATLLVVIRAQILSQPQGQTVFPLNTAAFSVQVEGRPWIGYQWQHNSVDIPGATSPTFTLLSVQSSDDGDYTAVVSDLAGSTTSAVARLEVLLQPLFTIQPTNILAVVTNIQTATVSNITFTAAATSGTPIRYQWFFYGTNLPGRTNAILVLTNATLANTGPYYVTATDDYGTAQSDTAIFDLIVKPVITQQPQNQTVLSGEDVTFSVTATGTTPIGFRWRRNTVNLTNGVGCQIVSGDADSTLVMSNVTYLNDVDKYSVVLNNLAPGSVVSSVFNGLLRVLHAPVITGQPTNLVLNAGTTAVFRATFRANPAGSYAWWFNETNLLSWGTNSTATNSFSITNTISNVRASNEGLYTLVVSNEYGLTTTTGATLTLRRPPTILVQPESKSVPIGTSVAFSVVVTGTPPFRYTWKFNGTNLPTAIGTNATLTLTNVQTTRQGNYFVVVTNTLGSATSVVATLTVYQPTTLRDVVFDSTSGNMKFSVPTQAGSTYYIEYAEDPASATWLPLSTLVGNGTVVTIEDQVQPAPSQRFYRIRIE